MNLREIDLRRLNSATKYPSIMTYHSLGEKGSLLAEHMDMGDDELIFTEKVDGTNSRVVIVPGGSYVIGSREELLHARGDLIYNPALGIVDSLQHVADRLMDALETRDDQLTVFYFETFGGRITAASKQYTGNASVSFRLFDVAKISPEILDRTPEEISRWREAGGQSFLREPELGEAAVTAAVELTPRLEITDPLPIEIDAVHRWLEEALPATKVALDENAKGEAEGIVARTSDRSRITKIRFDDYRRHARRSAKR